MSKKDHFVYASKPEPVKAQLHENGEGIEIGVGTGRFAVRKVRRVLKHAGHFILGFIDKSLVFYGLYEKGRRENVAEA